MVTASAFFLWEKKDYMNVSPSSLQLEPSNLVNWSGVSGQTEAEDLHWGTFTPTAVVFQKLS